MKSFAIILVFIAFGFSGCQSDGKPNQKALLTAIEKFNTAFARGDLATLDSMTTANYLHTNSSSKVIGKTDWFNYLEKRSANLESGEITVLRYQLDQTKIEYYGASAIVTGKKVKVKTSVRLVVEKRIQEKGIH
ncbi:MAG: nuclear transport factor 2 family protein, partial [Bacteroidota bacterium]